MILLPVIPLIEICAGPSITLMGKILEEVVDADGAIKKTIDEYSKQDLYLL